METSLDQIFHYYVANVGDRQRHLGDLIGDSGWDFNMSTGTLSFGPLQLAIQILGTESEGDQSWLWAWANAQSGIPEHLTTYARRLQAYGEEQHIAEFTDRSFPLSVADGHTLSVAATGLLGADAYYRGPYSGGALFMLITDAQVALPDGDRLQRLVFGFPQALSSFPITRHEDALFGHAATLGLTASRSDPSTVEITDGKGQVTATFDEHRRLTHLNATQGGG